ncbi:MAG TPA: diguanylate cyclase [Solirubrobacteraceae bacterium]|nr:diguanylate cyclase [Solirubrobacteraceae bacterium]
MAANDPNLRPDPVPPGRAYLSATALRRQLDEEVNRATRYGTHLSCLLLVIDNLTELTREHGDELLEHTLAYIGQALVRGLRNFDRVGRPGGSELVVVLPGADDLRGEVVARRVLKRLETIKLETDGTRRPLHISVGLAAWRDDSSGEDLLAQSRTAAANGASDPNGGLHALDGEQLDQSSPPEAPLSVGQPPLGEPTEPS